MVVVIPLPDKFSGLAEQIEVPQEIKEILLPVGQHLGFELNMGADLKELITSEKPLISYLNEGFSIHATA